MRKVAVSLVLLLNLSLPAACEWQETLDLKTGDLIRYEDHGNVIYKQENAGVIEIQAKINNSDIIENSSQSQGYDEDSR